MDNTVQILSALASVSAVVIAFISYRAYRYLLPKAQLTVKQDQVMNQIAGLILEFHDQQRTIASAITNDFPLDPYLLASRSRNAESLYQLIDNAIKLGLWKELTGSDTRDLSLQLFTVFRQSLASLVDLDPETSLPNDYLPQHVVMGILRVADQCRNYDRLELRNEIESVFGTMIRGDSLEGAWTYLTS